MSDSNLNDASFTPEINDSEESTNKQTYSATGSFRFWCQKVLPLVYDDSLSYYELLCKVVNYLNNVIQNVDNLNTSVDNTNTAFNNLQNYVNTTKDTLVDVYGKLEQYVNDYFNNLDVQEEINSKLDAMASDGSLSELLAPIIPSLVSDWLSKNITPTSPAIDASLSVSGAGADSKVTGDKLTALRNDLINNLKYLNSYNYLTDYPITTYGSGVTVSRSGDGGLNLAGTASDLFFVNFYANKTQMPTNLTPGNTYTAIFSGQNVAFSVYFYKNGSYFKGFDITETKQFTVPTDATGAVIRLEVNSGVTVNETVYPFIIDRSALLYKGILKNDLDIETLEETGIYTLAGNTSSPAPYGTLIHLESSEYVKVQILFELVDFKIWYRRWLSGTWYAWQTYGDTGFYNETEYIAFGDSLMYGALWNGTEDNPVITRATLGSRIPDRIKNAVHCYAYHNYAVGGMAYTFENGSIPKLIDWIKSKDISTADLITIGGGRNDGSSQLGTSESASGDGSICGAIREIIEYIRRVNPACQIVVIQVTPYTTSNNPWTSTSSSGWTLNDFDEQVSRLCKDMSVGYVSWYGCSMFSKWSDFSGGGGNWAHMKDEAQYIQMGNFIAGQVTRYYQN